MKSNKGFYTNVKNNFPRRTIAANGILDTLCIDLFDMSNDTYKAGYAMCAVDIFSRKCAIAKINKKDVASLQTGLLDIFRQYDNKTPNKILFDEESGMESHKMHEFLDSHNITLYHVNNSYLGADTHTVSIVERFNRTFKEYLLELKSQKLPLNWNQLMDKAISQFPDIYNNREHRTLKHTPNDVFYGKVSTQNVKIEQEERVNEPRKQPKEQLNIGTEVYLQKDKK